MNPPSTYTVGVSPTAKTSYYVSVGTDQSPRVAVAVQPAVALQASSIAPAVGDTVTFTVTVQPPSLAGSTVTLQTQTNGAWTTAGQATLGADGTCAFPWPATAAGTFSFQLQVPAAKGFSATTSAIITVTAGGSPSPSPSPAPSLTPTPTPSPATPSASPPIGT